MYTHIKRYLGAIALLFFLAGFVEEEPIKELTDKFNAYNQVFPQNKLVLTLNQPEYAPGDTIFFKAYLLSEDLMPVKGRQVASLVLLDNEGEEVIREAFAINDGTAANQTILPESLNGGAYRLVAYTHWMKNFSPKMYFSQVLPVASDNCFEPVSNLPLEIKLFPEGGNMVTGLPLRIVAEATKGGVPTEAEGRIVDAQGNELVRFATDKTGLAVFEATFSDQPYLLEALSNGAKTPIAINREGYALRVSKEDGLLRASIAAQSKRSSKESIYIIATSRGKVRYASMVTMAEGGEMSVWIPVKGIPEGIAQVSVFDSKLKELASRLVFVEGQERPDVHISLDKKIMSPRSAVRLEVGLSGEAGLSANTDFSISGVYSDLFPQWPEVDFREQLLVGSDILGSNYFLGTTDLDAPEGPALLDKYLITKKWERFHWDEVLSNKEKRPAYKPQDILVYEGFASFRDTGKAVPDSTQVLFFLQKNIFGYEVNTGDKGKVVWPVYFDFYGNEKVMYSMESKGKALPHTSIVLAHDSLPNPGLPTVVPTGKKDPYYAFNTIARVANTAYGYRWGVESPKIINANPNAAIEDELGGADFTIKVDDYVVFPTMEDLFREIVRFVQNRKVGGKQTLRVLSTDSNNPIMGDPLYVVDGIATRNTDFILNMAPGDIAIIKVVNNARKLRTLGSITKNGVVFFQTKVANMGALIPKEDIINIRGLNKPLPFSAMPAQPSGRTPYLKSTLYWNAQPQVNEMGQVSDVFYSADNTGTLRVRVWGIAPDGTPFDKTERAQVVFKPN